jgi:hypothetical protein
MSTKFKHLPFKIGDTCACCGGPEPDEIAHKIPLKECGRPRRAIVQEPGRVGLTHYNTCECVGRTEGCVYGYVKYGKVKKAYLRDIGCIHDRESFWTKERCRDCNAEYGKSHHLGCDMERCAKCMGQLLACSCPDERVYTSSC